LKMSFMVWSLSTESSWLSIEAMMNSFSDVKS
jgi:hypothetical protein